MIIKNLTDAAGNTPKIIGVGTQALKPGEEKNFPDALCLVSEYDELGNPTGKQIVLPSLKAQERLGLIKITETASKRASAKPVDVQAAAGDDGKAEEEKKAEAAAKRAATRAANKAAKEGPAE